MADPSPFAATVRAHDWPRYIATQFARQDKRADLFTLYAFDAEIDRITRIASDPLPGEIRLQWWREVLGGERADEGASHPLGMALLELIERYRLPLGAFESYLEAQTFALYHDAFPDTNSLEGWCGETSSIFIQMAAFVLDANAAEGAAEAAGHGGVALKIAGILSLLPQTRARGQCFLPQDLLAVCGLTRESFVAGEDNEAMTRATKAMAELGISHAEKFNAHAKHLPKSLTPAFLPCTTALLVLKRCNSRAADAHRANVQTSQLRKFAAMVWAAVK